jgi:hypothetical protein
MPRTRASKKPAEYDDLAKAIHRAIDVLEATGAISNNGADPDAAFYNGYCARACAAYAYLAEHEPKAKKLVKNPAMKLKFLKEPGAAYGDSHYWLESEDGQVLDLIFEQRKRLPRGIAYERGRGGTVRRDRTDKSVPLAKDTKAIITIVRAALR